MEKLKRYLLRGCAVFSLLLAACGGGGSEDATGTVQVALTDAVDVSFESVTVVIREVRVVPAGQEGVPEAALPRVAVFDPPKPVDILDLSFRQEFIGKAEIPAGRYSQVRLVLAPNTDPAVPANYLVLAGTTEKIPLNCPSGQESGLKILGPFSIADGGQTAVVLDFDPARAIVQAGDSGAWNIKPTGIRAIRTEVMLPVYGSLAGQVVQQTLDPVGATMLVPVAEAVVSALPVGSETPTASATVLGDGSFRLPLPVGDFRLKIEIPGGPPQIPPTIYTVRQGEETYAGDIIL